MPSGCSAGSESDLRHVRWLRWVEATFFRRRSTHIVVLHVLQGGLLAVFLLGYLLVAVHVSITGNYGWVSPAVVICVAIGLCGAVYGAIRFFFPERHMGALIVSAALVVFSGRGCADTSFYDELSLPQPPAYAGASLASPRDAGLLGDEEVLDAWLARMRTRRASPGPVVWPTQGEMRLARSGRAALRAGAEASAGPGGDEWRWHPRRGVDGARALQAAGPGRRAGLPPLRAPRHRGLRGHGGGGRVGGGAPSGRHRRTRASSAHDDAAGQPVLGGHRAAAALGESRGRALESAWVRHTDGLLGRTFRELRPGEAEGWLPSLVYTPMLVEDGRRLLVSNLDLHVPEASCGGGERWPRQKLTRLSLSGVQLFQLFPRKQRAFQVAAAARMSASFPYMSPASALPTPPRVRVVDAGYYDNYGVDLAVQWLHAHRQWVRECTSGVVLIQIRDHLGNGRRTKLQTAGAGASWLAG